MRGGEEEEERKKGPCLETITTQLYSNLLVTIVWRVNKNAPKHAHSSKQDFRTAKRFSVSAFSTSRFHL